MPHPDNRLKPPGKNSYRRQNYERNSNKPPQPTPKGPRPMRTMLIWMALFAIVALMFTVMQGMGEEPETISYAKLRELYEAGSIAAIVEYDTQGDNRLDIFYKPKSQKAPPDAVVKIRDNFWLVPWAADMQASIVKNGSPHYEFKHDPQMWAAVLMTMLPWLFIFVFIYFFFFRQLRAAGGAGGVLSFGRSQARMVNKDKQRVTFEDVAGVEEAKEEVAEIIEFLRNPSKFQKLGGRIPRGVLLVGAPGTGKTLLAKAVAGEADVPFFSICGSDFVEMFVGVGASRVRDLFKRAKENSPCIIFLDEVDAVGRRRGAGLGGGHDEREQTLNAILVEMDGFESDGGVILFAATNRPDVLDPALLRPGRFDREIVIDLPDVKGREEILKVHARHVKMADGVDLKTIARGTPMFSGADLEALVNEAALLAVMREKGAVTLREMEDSRDKVLWGREKKSRVMDEDDKKIISYHESGHAIIAKLLPEVEPLHKVTIIPRGMALGATISLPERDRYLMSKEKLLGQITSALGGRVSEALFLGADQVTSGAQNDFEHATRIARNMVTRWGMSDTIGTIDYSESEEHLFLGREITRTRSHSEATSQILDDEVRRIIDECYKRAEELIQAHRKEVEIIATALLRYEVLDALDIDWILEGKDIHERKEEQARQEEVELAEARAKTLAATEMDVLEMPDAASDTNPKAQEDGEQP